MRNKKIGYALLVVGVLLLAVGIGIVNARAHTPPDVVVERFYGDWIDALRGPTGPLERQLHVRSTYVSEEFGRAVERANERGRDGVLCVGGEPKTFEVVRSVIADDGRTAGVEFRVDGTEGRVILERDGRSWWRISEVDCPAPSVETATTTPLTP
jgi:hypothetical protein